MRKIKIILCISSLIAIILSSCGKQEPNIDLASIDISDIDSIIRNFWLTNIELQKLKSEVTEDEYKYTINEAEKKHFSYWLIIIVPFIMALVVLMFYYYFYQG